MYGVRAGLSYTASLRGGGGRACDYDVRWEVRRFRGMSPPRVLQTSLASLSCDESLTRPMIEDNKKQQQPIVPAMTKGARGRVVWKSRLDSHSRKWRTSKGNAQSVVVVATTAARPILTRKIQGGVDVVGVGSGSGVRRAGWLPPFLNQLGAPPAPLGISSWLWPAMAPRWRWHEGSWRRHEVGGRTG
jgi:hypothetical protein